MDTVNNTGLRRNGTIGIKNARQTKPNLMIPRPLKERIPNLNRRMPRLQLNPSGEVSIGFIIGVFRKWWWLVGVSCAFAVIAAIYTVSTAKREYTVSIEMTEAANDQPTSPLSGSGALAALSGLGFTTRSDGDMQLYLHLLRSIEVADRVAAEPVLLRRMFPHLWDEPSSSWREPPATLVQQVKNLIKRVLGVGSLTWQPPGAREALTYLQDNISVKQTRGVPVTTIQFEHEDPMFARDLLLFLHRQADDILRARAIARADSNIEYLTRQLSLVTVAEHRLGLIQTLSDQEKRRMAANSGSAFTAEIFSGPVISHGPTSPKPNRILLIFLALGFILPATFLLILEYARAATTQELE